MNLKKINLIIMLLTSLIFVFSCNGEEEDPYLSTELSGVYKYKSAYMKENCNDDDHGYTIDIQDELAQPYFLLEGRKGLSDSSNKILTYDCEDRSMNTCKKIDDSGSEIEKVFANGGDEAWVLKDKVSAKYDYSKNACIFTREEPTEYKLTAPIPTKEIGIDDLLEVKIKFYTYEDEELSSKDCRISKIVYSKFICTAKKKISSRRVVLNPKDQEYFDKKEQEEDTGE